MTTSSPSEPAPGARGLLVGRFQPFHLGHLRAVQRLRQERPQEGVLLGIGSAQESYTARNPFTAGERLEMIEAALAGAHVTCVLPVPLPDIDRHAQWVAYVASMLPAFRRVYTNNPLTRLLFQDAGYEVLPVPFEERDRLSGTDIRRALATGGDWASRVPPAVAGFLERVQGPERMRMLLSKDTTSAAPARP